MRMNVLALSLAVALAACGSRTPTPATPAAAPAADTAYHAGLNIKLSTIYVDDQAKALAFYTDVLGFQTKEDVENGGYRWLTVVAPQDPMGAAIHLALTASPAVKAFQEAQFKDGQAAMMFYTTDIKADFERMKAKGATFTMEPTEVYPGSTIATLEDGCGNIIQISQIEGE